MGPNQLCDVGGSGTLGDGVNGEDRAQADLTSRLHYNSHEALEHRRRLQLNYSDCTDLRGVQFKAVTVENARF